MEIESYLLKELIKEDMKDPRTIKNSPRYLAVRIYSPTITKRYEQGKQNTPYSIRYIRLEDIKKALKWKVEINFIS